MKSLLASLTIVFFLIAETPASAQAQQDFWAKYEGGQPGIEKKHKGRINFDNEKRELVFLKDGKKRMFAIPYDSITIVTADEKARRRVKETLILGVTLIGLFALPILFSKKTLCYVMVEYSDPEADIAGAAVFQVKGRDKAGVLALLAQKADLERQSEDLYARGGIDVETPAEEGEVQDTAGGTVAQGPKPEPAPQPGHTELVNSVAFSPNGRWLASGSSDKTIKLWDVATGEELRTLTGHTDFVSSVAFSPDGHWLASGSSDRTIKLWDVATGEELRTLTGHTQGVGPVAFSPDGHWLASGSSDRTIKLWDMATGRELRTLTGHAIDVQTVAFSPDGRRLASGSVDRTIRFWDVATGQELRTLTGHTLPVTSVAFSPDGRWLASGCTDKVIKLWDVATGREVRTLPGHAGWIWSVAFSPDGRWLASGGWSPRSVASPGETIKLWDVATGEELRTLTGHPLVQSLAFSPDGRWLASGSVEKTIKLWDVATGRELRTLPGHTEGELRETAKETVAQSPKPEPALQPGHTEGEVQEMREESEEAPPRVAAELVGGWSGETSQGFPISLKIEEVEGKAVVTWVKFNIRMQGPGFGVTRTMIQPDVISAEVVEGKFQESWSSPGDHSSVLNGEFSSPSSLSGSLRVSHPHPQGYGTAVGEVTYTATKKQGEKTNELGSASAQAPAAGSAGPKPEPALQPGHTEEEVQETAGEAVAQSPKQGQPVLSFHKYEGVEIALLFVERTSIYKGMYRPKERDREFAVIHLKVRFPETAQALVFGKEVVELRDVDGHTAGYPYEVQAQFGRAEEREVTLPFIVPKGVQLKELRIGDITFDLETLSNKGEAKPHPAQAPAASSAGPEPQLVHQALAQEVRPSAGKQATKLSESEAASTLDEILLKQDLAADVFVADVNGNGVPDFVAIYTAGRGEVLQKLGPLPASSSITEKGILRAEFATLALGTISVMQNENLDWEADLVYLLTSDHLDKVPVQKVAKCHSVAGKPQEWKTCLVRAWTQAETTPRNEVSFDHLLSTPLPPNGFVKRFQEQTPTGLLPISTQGSSLHHFVAVRDSKNGEISATVFVRAGQRVWMEVPAGSYKINYATGKEWEGSENLFGPETKCFEMETVFESPPWSSQLGLVSIAPLGNAAGRTMDCADFGHETTSSPRLNFPP